MTRARSLEMMVEYGDRFVLVLTIKKQKRMLEMDDEETKKHDTSAPTSTRRSAAGPEVGNHAMELSGDAVQPLRFD